MQAYKPKLGDLVRIKLKLRETTLYEGLLIDSIHDRPSDPGIYKILVFDSYRTGRFADPEPTRWFDLRNNVSTTIELIQELEKSNVTE